MGAAVGLVFLWVYFFYIWLFYGYVMNYARVRANKSFPEHASERVCFIEDILSVFIGA